MLVGGRRPRHRAGEGQEPRTVPSPGSVRSCSATAPLRFGLIRYRGPGANARETRVFSRFCWHDGPMEEREDSEMPYARCTLTLRVSAGPGVETDAHLVSLRDWLAAEDALRGRVELPARPPQPGQMGAALDVLAVALGSGGAGAVLARSLSTWLVQRRTDITVHVSRGDGQDVTVEVRRASDPQAVIGAVGQLLEGGEE